MSLDYDKLRSQAESPQTSMSAYSDLFAALAFIFLFLYVVSNIHLSLEAISSKIEADKYEAKLQAYEIPSHEAPTAGESESSEDYAEILQALAALEKQTKEEADKIYKQAQALQEYEQELISKYQTVVDMVKKKNIDLKTELDQQNLEAREKQTDYDLMIARQQEKFFNELSAVQQQLERRKTQVENLEIDLQTIAADKDKLFQDQNRIQQELDSTLAKIQTLEK